MINLLLDTSTATFTLIISKEEQELKKIELNNMKEHSKYALSSIKEAFSELKLDPNDIDNIIVINGPGSFTGTRIGVTIAKTYAVALNKKIYSISSLKANALSYDNSDYYVVFIDARRDKVFGAIYDHNYQEILKEQYLDFVVLLEEASQLNGKKTYIGDCLSNDISIKPLKININVINYVLKNYKPLNPHLVNPNYLKLVEAEERKNQVKHDSKL